MLNKQSKIYSNKRVKAKKELVKSGQQVENDGKFFTYHKINLWLNEHRYLYSH